MDDSSDRREHDRFAVTWEVDCITDETFLFSTIANVSAMGIFVRTTEPLAVGTRVLLRFAPPGGPAFELPGQVAWVNRVREDGDNINPGMGVRFVSLDAADRSRLLTVIRTLAYVTEPN